jgi:hypothetical protein
MSHSEEVSRLASMHVEKISVPVRVAHTDTDPRDGQFLLYSSLGNSGRSETLLELLNSKRRSIIPFLQVDQSEVLFLNRENIDWVVIAAGVDERLVYPPDHLVTIEQGVEFRLIDGSRVQATIQWDAKDGTVRLSDHLNTTGTFITAKTSFGLLLINKRRVRETSMAEKKARRLIETGDSQRKTA